MKKLIGLILCLVLFVSCASEAQTQANAGGKAKQINFEYESEEDKQLAQKLGSELFSDVCIFRSADFDNDGVIEAFAVVGKGEEFRSHKFNGELYFITPNTVKKISKASDSYKDFSIAQFTEESIVLINKWPGDYSQSDFYRVQGEEFFAIPAPKWVIAIKGDMLIFQDEMDDYYESASDTVVGGTTYNRYWFYYKNGKINEYGGIYITEEELCRFNGGTEILEEMKTNKCKIKNIIYRANNYITINYITPSEEDEQHNNFNVSYVWEDGQLTKPSNAKHGGHYKLALMPQLAVNPEKLPV